ncbi:hypothetical protein P4E94_09740 [Pontiellaceae bacterium B12219]|nr:hypothetical protein [Pontiellaceae bacterium B12219]
MKMKSRVKRKEGQAMVEYIIIVAVVAIAALVLFGMFGDTIKQKLGGAINELDSTTNVTVEDGESLQGLKDLDAR